ncbi:MAG TPA: hypothetical protein VFU72_09245 [Nitrolancea sp.]|nr:hypothetical protein [Nitrolancea sp.]
MSGPAGFFELHVSVDGVEEINRRFVALHQRVSDLSPAFAAIGDELRADFGLNMATEGGRYGGWAPLAPSTIKEKARRWPGAPMEWRTGMLGRSLSQLGAPGNVSVVSAMSAMFGTSIPYATFQHFGTRRMPARKLVGLSWYTKSKIVRAVADYIRQASGGMATP